MNIDKAYDIYEEFLLQNREHGHYESVRCKVDGDEKLLLKFDCGFTVELTNNKRVENSAALHCWWNEENVIEVNNLKQLIQAWSNSN